MLKAIKIAVHMKLKSEDAFDKFTKTFPREAVDKWVEMVIAWDRDKKEQNPYEEPMPSKHLYNSVVLQQLTIPQRSLSQVSCLNLQTKIQRKLAREFRSYMKPRRRAFYRRD